MSSIEGIRAHISNGNTEKALESIGQMATGDSSGWTDEVVNLSARYTRIKSKSAGGLLTYAQEEASVNKLHKDILYVANQIESGKPPPKPPKLFTPYRTVLIILAIVFSVLLLILLIKKQDNIPATIRMHTSFLAFKVATTGDLKLNTEYKIVDFLRFSEIQIPAGEFILDNFDQDRMEIFNEIREGVLVLKNISTSESSVFLDDITIHSLNLKKNSNAEFMLSSVDESLFSTLSLGVNPGDLQGRYSFNDSLIFSCSFITIDNLSDQTLSLESGMGLVYLSDPGNYVGRFSGHSDEFAMNIEDTLHLFFSDSDPGFDISKASFDFESDGDKKSGIISGAVSWLDKNNKEYESINIANAEFLSFEDHGSLNLSNFYVNRHGIFLVLSGKLGKVRYGLDNDDLNEVNPNLLMWYSDFYRMIIPLPAILSILLTAVIGLMVQNIFKAARSSAQR